MKSAQIAAEPFFFCSKGNPESYKKWSHFDELMLAVIWLVFTFMGLGAGWQVILVI